MIINQEEIRKRVRLLKAIKGISYKELASYAEMGESSMYNWLRKQYNLSFGRITKLITVLEALEG